MPSKSTLIYVTLIIFVIIIIIYPIDKPSEFHQDRAISFEVIDFCSWGEKYPQGRGDGLEVEPMSRNPEGRGSIPRLGSRRSSLISIEHVELLRSTPSLGLCCAWLVTMALHVHGGLGQLSPLPTSGDDK